MALEDMVYGEHGGRVKMRVGLNDLNGLFTTSMILILWKCREEA